ncbi:MAG TPA: ABC transporter permease [Syntrophorhabdaceae bacterium]|nr:ABC transporter permease [Syntrophorhabdaceae bacterium]
MAAFILRRLIQTIVVLLIVSIIGFLIIHLIPGDPALTMLGENATQEQINALRTQLGLDQPVVVQYLRWLINVLHGNLGKSLMYGESVTSLVASRLPVTFHLGIIALILGTLISVPAGIIAAVRRGGVLDQLITVSANLGMAIPLFWLGILGIYLFSLKLGWLPVQGYTSPFDNFSLNLKQIIMPVICLAVVPLASLTRQTRSSMLEVIRQDYIRTARSKGLKERVIIFKHALRNAVIPVVTLLGIQVRNLVGGSVLVETVFNISGIGRLMVKSVFDKDFLVVQGCVLMIAFVVALANLLVDLSYGWLDPRIRQEE